MMGLEYNAMLLAVTEKLWTHSVHPNCLRDCCWHAQACVNITLTSFSQVVHIGGSIASIAIAKYTSH